MFKRFKKFSWPFFAIMALLFDFCMSSEALEGGGMRGHHFKSEVPKYIENDLYHNFQANFEEGQNFNFLLKVKIKIGHGAIFDFQ